MRKAFTITVDLSRIFNNGSETLYTILIDESKMTIVYEVVEWIRWIFSLEKCFYLAHENSIIHELDDIKVLHFLKDFELRPCNDFNCIHKKLYRNLLSKLNLFVDWENVRVPKIFHDKISLIFEKFTNVHDLTINEENKFITNKIIPLDLNSSSECKNTQIKMDDTLIKKPSTYNLAKVFERYKKIVIDENQNPNIKINYHKGENPMEHDKCLDTKSKNNELSNDTDNNINKNSNATLSENFAGKSSVLLGEKSQVHSEMDLTYSITNSSPFSSTVFNTDLKSHEKFTVRNEESLTKKPKLCEKSENLKANKCKKPFSVGEILSSLREENKKKHNENSIKVELPSQNELYNIFVDFKKAHIDKDIRNQTQQNVCLKKRNRRRSRKSKKSKLETSGNNDCLADSFMVLESGCDINKSMSEIKPWHIRFNSDDEDEVEHGCDKIKDCKDESTTDNKDSKLGNNDLKDLIALINNRKETLCSSPKPNISNIKDKNEAEQLSTLANTEQPLGDPEPPKTDFTTENLKSKNFNRDSDALISLKEKFPSPVIIDRFF